MGAKEILTEVVLKSLVNMHSLLKTRLPYPWDFCRLDLSEDTRLILNSGSYFVVYAAFIFWFIKYIVQRIEFEARHELTSKDYILAVIMAFATATQLLWPLCLISLWFVTWSFYPWVTALLVLSLNFPDEAQALFRFTMFKSKKIIEASAVTFSNISLDAVRRDDDEEGLSMDDINIEDECRSLERGGSFILPQFGSNRSEEYTSLWTPFTPLRRTSQTEERSVDDIVPHRYGPEVSDSTDISLVTTPMQDIVLGNERRDQNHMTVPRIQSADEYVWEESMDYVPREQRGESRRAEQFIRDEEFMRERSSLHRETSSQSTHRTEGSSVSRLIQSTGTQKKMGFHNRCWRIDDLSFKQAFLREPFTTRRNMDANTRG